MRFWALTTVSVTNGIGRALFVLGGRGGVVLSVDGRVVMLRMLLRKTL